MSKKAKRPILVFVPLEGPTVVVRPPAQSPWSLDLTNDLMQRPLIDRSTPLSYAVMGTIVEYRAKTPPTAYGGGRRWDMERERRPSGRLLLRFTELPNTPMSVDEIVRRLSWGPHPAA